VRAAAAEAVRPNDFFNSLELGIRHEDTVVATNEGSENLAPKWSGTPEEPAVV
jgi:hypothetical protein